MINIFTMLHKSHPGLTAEEIPRDINDDLIHVVQTWELSCVPQRPLWELLHAIAMIFSSLRCPCPASRSSQCSSGPTGGSQTISLNLTKESHSWCQALGFGFQNFVRRSLLGWSRPPIWNLIPRGRPQARQLTTRFHRKKRKKRRVSSPLNSANMFFSCISHPNGLNLQAASSLKLPYDCSAPSTNAPVDMPRRLSEGINPSLSCLQGRNLKTWTETWLWRFPNVPTFWNMATQVNRRACCNLSPGLAMNSCRNFWKIIR